MNSKAFVLSWTGLFCCCLILAGCAGRYPVRISMEDQAALDLALTAQQINAGITTCKGMAWLTLKDSNKPDQKYRLAWAAAPPDKIRMTLLSAGLPMETILADGKQVTFVSHVGSHDRHTLNSSDPPLEKLLSIPVSLTEIVALLAGRIPVKPFDKATWSEKDEDRKSVILTRKWKGTIGKIWWNRSDEVYMVQALDTKGNPVYSLYRNDIRDQGSVRIPFNYRITDNDGRSLALEITQFQPNIQVKPSVFSLTDARE
ncbi:MAG: hypothetical protein V1793_10460 [Pseudomonadota bacterium]